MGAQLHAGTVYVPPDAAPEMKTRPSTAVERRFVVSRRIMTKIWNLWQSVRGAAECRRKSSDFSNGRPIRLVPLHDPGLLEGHCAPLSPGRQRHYSLHIGARG